MVALGAWAADGSSAPPPPPPSPPDLGAAGFDANEPCPQTELVGSGIDYRLMENQVREVGSGVRGMCRVSDKIAAAD
jgi:hypothetical protein